MLFSKQYIESYKSTLILAIPVIISQLGHIMVGVVDTAFVGHIGPNEQAAVALANSMYYLILAFGLGISMGVTPLAAAADSAKDKTQSAALLKNAVVVNTAVGIILFLILYLLSPLMNLLNQKQEVISNAIPFLNVMILGMIPLCFFSAYKQFAEGLSFTTVAMIITISANIINIILNYLLIFGKWGFPEMGMIGSAWASFIARCLMAVSIFLYVRYNKNFKFIWKEFSAIKVSQKVMKQILAIGIPSGLQWVFEIGAFAFAVVMIGWIGAKEQAAHQVALSIAAITYMMANGLSSATAVKVGNQLGLKSKSGIRIAGFSSFIMVLTFMSSTAFLFIIGNNWLPTFFSNDVNVLKISSSLLLIAAAFQLSDGLQVVALGALRGLKDTKIPTIITLVAYWVIALPASYIFGFTFELGLQGIWYGLVLGLTAAAILLFLRYNYVSKRVIE